MPKFRRDFMVRNLFELKAPARKWYIGRMKRILSIVVRAGAIVVVSSLIGIGVNAFNPSAIPWIYEPPKVVEVGGVKIPVIGEVEAHAVMDDGNTVFIDAREEADFIEERIRGAISMPEPAMAETFPMVEPMIDPDSKIIVYCSGPECDMAEKVAVFLKQLGYTDTAVMTSGLPAWKKAGFPVEKG